MSYNIDNCDVKAIHDFKIPLAALLEYDDIAIELRKEYVYVSGSVEGFEMYGELNIQHEIEIDGLAYHGSWSGNWYENFKNILKKSTGCLKILLVWEDGAIDMLVVNNGELIFTDLSELQ